MDIALAFILGALACWAVSRLLRAVAFGSTKIGSDARQKWLTQMTYDSLLRHRKQIDDEIAKRQP